MLALAAILVVRRKQLDDERAYQTPFYPFVPATQLAVYAWFLFTFFFARPAAASIGFGMITARLRSITGSGGEPDSASAVTDLSVGGDVRFLIDSDDQTEVAAVSGFEIASGGFEGILIRAVQGIFPYCVSKMAEWLRRYFWQRGTLSCFNGPRCRQHGVPTWM
jgi:hypothetical protein